MRKIFLIITILGALVLFSSCGSKSNSEASGTEEGETAEEHAEDSNPNIAVLTEEQMKSINIKRGKIKKKKLTAPKKKKGIWRVQNKNKGSVNSIYRGVIKSLSVQ